jgi:cell division protein FtsQ
MLEAVADRAVGIHPKMWSRRVQVTRANGRRRLRFLLIALGFCVLGGGGFASLHSGLFAAANLKVVGAEETTPEQVLASSGLLRHPPLIDINRSAMIRRIESLPWIKSATVSEHWPDSVTVVVTERQPVAAIDPSPTGVAPTVAGARTWVLVDDTGRILAVVVSRPAGLPALTVAVPPGKPGSYLSGADEPAVVVASSLPETIAARTASIELASDGGVTLDLTGRITAIIGQPVELDAKYEALASLLASAAIEPGDVVDVTVPEEPTVGAS